jgi:hypothetical protein
MALRENVGRDLALRVAGLALLCVAARIASGLFGSGPRAAVAVDYLLAAGGFLAASAGSALAWQGHHLFDQIVLSSRWTFHESAGAGLDEGRRAVP